MKTEPGICTPEGWTSSDSNKWAWVNFFSMFWGKVRTGILWTWHPQNHDLLLSSWSCLLQVAHMVNARTRLDLALDSRALGCSQMLLLPGLGEKSWLSQKGYFSLFHLAIWFSDINCGFCQSPFSGWHPHCYRQPAHEAPTWTMCFFQKSRYCEPTSSSKFLSPG